MRKYAVILFLSLFIFGCGSQPKDKKVLARINNYEITADEFEEEFKDSTFGSVDTIESRKEFLDNLINRKLILQAAQNRGLDKKRSFLKSIEKFWEQSLLKITLDIKTKEIISSIHVSDKTVQEAYQKRLQEGKTDKTYEGVRDQIKWEIINTTGHQLLNDWITELRKEAVVKVNYDLLKQDK